MSVYLDASALVKLYREEPASHAVTRLLAEAEQWVSARHSYVEVRRAIWRTLPGAVAVPARNQFEEDWNSFDVVELDESTCIGAAAVAENTGLRTLDALHLAAAQRAGGGELTFVTFDERQAAAARSFGWTVAGV